MSREFLHAYFKAQAAHKSLHRLTKSFEEELPDQVILDGSPNRAEHDRLEAVERLLAEVRDQIVLSSIKHSTFN